MIWEVINMSFFYLHCVPFAIIHTFLLFLVSPHYFWLLSILQQQLTHHPLFSELVNSAKWGVMVANANSFAKSVNMLEDQCIVELGSNTFRRGFHRYRRPIQPVSYEEGFLLWKPIKPWHSFQLWFIVF